MDSKSYSNDFPEDARKLQIARALAARGNVADVQRYDRGLMPEEEQRGHLRAALFAPLDGFERFEKMYPSDVPHEDGGAHCIAKVSFASYDARELVPEEFAVLTAIEEVLLKTVGDRACYAVTPREHCARCGSCAAEASRRSIRVQMVVGDWTLTREYAAPQGVIPGVVPSCDRGDEPTAAQPAQRIDPHPAGSPSGLLEVAIHILCANAEEINHPTTGLGCYAVPIDDVEALRDLLEGKVSETIRGRG
jgi:hypothetical protein